MKDIGDKAEQKAVEYIVSHGMKVIDRNWRADGGELDIIARYKKQIHFIEVKARRSGLDQAWLAVNTVKQQRLSRTAQHWITLNGKEKWSYQFDVIGVSGDSIEWRQHVIEQ